METVLAGFEGLRAWADHFSGYMSLALGLAFLFQWVAIQYLFIQNHFLKIEMKKPHPDLGRIRRYETQLSNLEGQLPLIFEKLAEHNQEIREMSLESKTAPQGTSARQENSSPSMESSYASMGEINLKKRLEAIKKSAPRPS